MGGKNFGRTVLDFLRYIRALLNPFIAYVREHDINIKIYSKYMVQKEQLKKILF